MSTELYTSNSEPIELKLRCLPIRATGGGGYRQCINCGDWYCDKHDCLCRTIHDHPRQKNNKGVAEKFETATEPVLLPSVSTIKTENKLVQDQKPPPPKEAGPIANKMENSEARIVQDISRFDEQDIKMEKNLEVRLDLKSVAVNIGRCRQIETLNVVIPANKQNEATSKHLEWLINSLLSLTQLREFSLKWQSPKTLFGDSQPIDLFLNDIKIMKREVLFDLIKAVGMSFNKGTERLELRYLVKNSARDPEHEGFFDAPPERDVKDYLKELKHLDLGNNIFGPKDIKRIERWLPLESIKKNLQVLILNNTCIKDEGIQQVVLFRQLRTLSISNCQIGLKGVEELVKEWPTQLIRLEIAHNPIGADGVSRLTKQPSQLSLQYLDISDISRGSFQLSFDRLPISLKCLVAHSNKLTKKEIVHMLDNNTQINKKGFLLMIRSPVDQERWKHLSQDEVLSLRKDYRFIDIDA